jgi:putative glutamine amidotransferase
MNSSPFPPGRRRPLIGCTTYRKTADNNPPIELFGIRPAYIEAIVAAGGIPILIPLGLSEEDLLTVLAEVDGLLLPGGGDVAPSLYQGVSDHATIAGVDPDRDRVEFALVRAAVAQQKPLLAICRGHQVLNVALGGTLWEDVYSQMHGAALHDYYRSHPLNHLAHSVDVCPGSCLAHYLAKPQTQVNSLHHQGIRRLAPELAVAAVAPDGLIEAVEAPGHPFALGVQWHPENLIHDDPSMLALFRGLVEAASG